MQEEEVLELLKSIDGNVDTIKLMYAFIMLIMVIVLVFPLQKKEKTRTRTGDNH